MGTVEKRTWQEGMIEPLKIEGIWEHTADIKEYLFPGYEPGGWVPPDSEAPKSLGKCISGHGGVSPFMGSRSFSAGWSLTTVMGCF
jgi:hypothetical protein